MARRLVARTGRTHTGLQCAISADIEANVCAVVVTSGAAKVGEVEIPGGLLHELIGGLDMAFEELRRQPARRPRQGRA